MVNIDTDDRGGQAPISQLQTMHTLSPHKLCRFFQLQPMEDPVAASWFLGALEGHVKQEILSLGAEHVNTLAKILTSSSRTLGGGEASGRLHPGCGISIRRQQELTESVEEYTTSLGLLWAKTNTAQAGTLSNTKLCDTFVSGLHPDVPKKKT